MMPSALSNDFTLFQQKYKRIKNFLFLMRFLKTLSWQNAFEVNTEESVHGDKTETYSAIWTQGSRKQKSQVEV